MNNKMSIIKCHHFALSIGTYDFSSKMKYNNNKKMEKKERQQQKMLAIG